MDRMDREILAALQQDGKITLTALAEQVQVSVSACHRRVRELERSGVIRDYRARIDAASVDLGFQAFLFVTMREGGADVLERFEEALRNVAEVIDAQRLFGDPDYLVRVATRDLDTFQRLYDEHLSALPGVLRLSSTLVMKQIVHDRPLPIR